MTMPVDMSVWVGESSQGPTPTCSATRQSMTAKRGCISYFSVSVIKHHGQDNLQKKEFVWLIVSEH